MVTLENTLVKNPRVFLKQQEERTFYFLLLKETHGSFLKKKFCWKILLKFICIWKFERLFLNRSFFKEKM